MIGFGKDPRRESGGLVCREGFVPRRFSACRCIESPDGGRTIFTAVSVFFLVFACLESDSRHDDRIITQQKPINARKKSIATFGAIAKKQNEKHSEPSLSIQVSTKTIIDRTSW